MNDKILDKDLCKKGATAKLYVKETPFKSIEKLTQEEITSAKENGELKEIKGIKHMSENFKYPKTRHSKVLKENCCDNLGNVRDLLKEERHSSIQKIYFGKSTSSIEFATNQDDEHSFRGLKRAKGLIDKQQELEEFLATVEQSAGNMYHMSRVVLKENNAECPMDFKDWACPCTQKVIDEYRTKKYKDAKAMCDKHGLKLPQSIEYHFKSVEDWDSLWRDFWDKNS